jgi:hypothetical protein
LYYTDTNIISVSDKGNVICDYKVYKVVLYNLIYVLFGGHAVT